VKWRKIKQSLDRIGVDADTATVRKGKIKWAGEELVPLNKRQCALREELERLTQQYQAMTQIRTPTAHQLVKEITVDIKKIAAARDLFEPYQWPVAYLIGDKNAAAIYQLLAAVETELQVKAKRELASYGAQLRYGKQDNASKLALCDYFLRLAALWDELADESSKPRHRNSFMKACAAPVMPNLTIKNVRDYLSKKTKTKNF
jgi:hypothetical protein